MALFGKKDKKEEKKPATKKAAPKKAVSKKAESKATRSFDHVLIAPRITEKSAIATERNVYVFDIAPCATKIDVKEAMKAVYNVTPIKVTTTRVPSRKVVYRGKRGVKKGGKKAYVYLNKEDKIELI
jgi:large subunit ribosomal protein L23